MNVDDEFELNFDEAYENFIESILEDINSHFDNGTTRFVLSGEMGVVEDYGTGKFIQLLSDNGYLTEVRDGELIVLKSHDK